MKKKDKDDYRLILDLSDLNEDYVEYKKFKMDTLKSILRMVTPNCWFYSIDFSDAYLYSIPIHPRLRKYLRFELDGKLYQYSAVPNNWGGVDYSLAAKSTTPPQLLRTPPIIRLVIFSGTFVRVTDFSFGHVCEFSY